MVCPLEKTAQPIASVLHTAGIVAVSLHALRIKLAAKIAEKKENKRIMDFYEFSFNHQRHLAGAQAAPEYGNCSHALERLHRADNCRVDQNFHFSMGDHKQFLAAGAFLRDGFFACLVAFLPHFGNHFLLLGCKSMENIRLFEEVD